MTTPREIVGDIRKKMWQELVVRPIVREAVRESAADPGAGVSFEQRTVEDALREALGQPES